MMHLVFNLHEDGDSMTVESILVDTSSKVRCIQQNKEYIRSMYSKDDLIDILCSEKTKSNTNKETK
jgi:hypothetical protein